LNELKFAEDVSTKLAILKKNLMLVIYQKTAYESEKLNISNEYLKKNKVDAIGITGLDIYKKDYEQR
jgi:hypothetical protein